MDQDQDQDQDQKKPYFSFLFKRLGKKGSWRFAGSSGFRWKQRRFSVHVWFVDGILFRIVYVLESVVLVSALCFYYLCCGCKL